MTEREDQGPIMTIEQERLTDIGTGNHDCLAKRRPGEPMFILLGRDPDAHNIVRMWAQRRLDAGGDPDHCQSVFAIADAMQEYAADPANRPASAPNAEDYPALKSPPIGGEREIGAPIDPPVDVTPLEREFLAAHYERVGNPTLATEIRSVHWRVGFGTSEASFIQAIRDALAIGVSEPTTSGDVGKLCERLRTAARSSSCVQRSMAEAKSLRNSDGEHKDLYMWPAPEQTLEGQAATLLTQMEARTAALEKANQQATELIDEINLRAPSRQFNGIGFGLHAKLCTIRATLARALLNPTPTASTGEA